MSDTYEPGPNDFVVEGGDGTHFLFVESGGDYIVFSDEGDQWELFATYDLPEDLTPDDVTEALDDPDVADIGEWLDDQGAELTIESVATIDFTDEEAGEVPSLGSDGEEPGIHDGSAPTGAQETDEEEETPPDSESEEPTDVPGDGEGEGEGEGEDGSGEEDEAPAEPEITESARRAREAAVDRYNEARDAYDDAVSALGDAVDEAEGLADEIDALGDEADGIADDLEDIGDDLEEFQEAFDEIDGPLGDLDDLAGRVANLGSSLSSDGLADVGVPDVNATVPDTIDFPQRGADPVSLHSGAYVLRSVDLHVDGFAGPTVVERRYSNQTYHVGSFGAKWDSWIDAHVRVLSSGSVYVWTGECRGVMCARSADGSFAVPVSERFELLLLGSTFRLVDREGMITRFDDDGRLVERRDRFGNTWTVERDDAGRPTGLTDPNGRAVAFTTASGRIASMADWSGRTWTYSYDSDANLVEVSWPGTGNGSVRYDYESGGDARMRHNLVGVVDERGVTVLENRFGTDGAAFNRVDRQVAVEAVTEFEYEIVDTIDAIDDHRGSTARRTTVTDHDGTATVHEFDPFGSLVAERRPHGTGTAEFRYSYDAVGHHTGTTFPDGRGRRFAYDLTNTDSLRRHDLVEIADVADDGSELLTSVEYGSFGQVRSFTSVDGEIVEYELDGLARVTEIRGPVVTATDGSTSRPVSTFTYNSRNQLVTVTTPAGHVHRFTYRGGDGNLGQLHRISVDGVTQQTLTHDDLWRVVSVNDALGASYAHEYDERDRVVALDSPIPGARIEFEHDRAGRLVQRREQLSDENGAPVGTGWIEVNYVVDDRGRTVRVDRPIGPGQIASVTFEWDHADRLVAFVDAVGRRTETVFDGAGRPTTRIRDAGTSVETVESWFYDAAGAVTRHVDVRGNSTHFGYDSFGRISEVTDALGRTIEHAFTPSGLAETVKVVDQAGVTRAHERFEHDELSRIRTHERRVISEDGTATDWLATHFDYDIQGRLVSQTLPGGSTVSSEYDSTNRIRSVTDAVGNRVDYVRDENGNVVEVRDTAVGGASVVHVFTYDAMGRLTSAGNALGASESHEYDSRGRRVATIRADGVTERFEYDEGDRLVTITVPSIAPDGSTAPDVQYRYAYDAAGRPVHVVDPNGGLTRLTRDAAGRLASIILPDGALHQAFTYDAAGAVASRTDGAGTRIEYDYDAVGRLIELNAAAAPGVLGGGSTTFSWDANDQVVAVDNGVHASTWKVDSIGRIWAESLDGRTVTRTFGANGLVDSESLAGLLEIDATWNAAGQLSSLTAAGSAAGFPGGPLPSEPLVEYDYESSRPSLIALGNDVDVELSYDEAGRLVGVSALRDGGTALEAIELLRDAVGRVCVRRRDGIESRAHEFDSLGRMRTTHVGADPGLLTAAAAADQTTVDAMIAAETARIGSGAASTTQYEYDPAGNRTKLERTDTSASTVVDFSLDAAHRLAAVDGAPIASDPVGNVASALDHEYAYDASNRLMRVTRISDGVVVLDATRDGLGRIVSLSVEGVRREWLWSGDHVVAVFDASGAAEQVVVPGPFVDQPVAAFSGMRTWYAVRDHVATVLAWTDDAGLAVERFVRDEFGVLEQRLDGAFTPQPPRSIETEAGFQGRPTWSELDGLHDFRARAYQPDWGRFLQPDPRGLGVDPALYLFARNDPTRFVDPDGEIPVLVVTAGIGALVGGAIGAGMAAYQGGDLADIAVAGLAGAAGGALMGSGLGLAGFVAGGAVSGGIVGAWEGYKAGGWRGAAIGTTFGATVGAVGGLAGGVIGETVGTAVTGAVVRGLTRRGVSGVTAYVIGADVGVVLGGAGGGSVAGGLGAFGLGTGVGLAAGQDLETSLRQGLSGVPSGMAYGAAMGAVGAYSTKALMNRYAFQTTNEGALGGEGEFFARNAFRQTPNEEMPTPFETPEGKVPDFWGRVKADVKNTAEIPSMGKQGGQLQSFVDALGPGETLVLMHRPGVRAPATGEVATHPRIDLQPIPHWAFPPQVYRPYCDGG